MYLFVSALVVKKEEGPDGKGKGERRKSVRRCQNYAKYIYSGSFVNIIVLINDLGHTSVESRCATNDYVT
jgi:hypothetical protein